MGNVRPLIVNYVIGIITLCSATDSTTVYLTQGNNCSLHTDQNVMAYIGWPFVISCENLYYDFLGAIFMEEDKWTNVSAACVIRDGSSGVILSNETFLYDPNTPADVIDNIAYVLGDVTDDMASSYLVQFQVGTTCIANNVYLQKRSAPDPKCNDPPYLSEFKMIHGKHQELSCIAKRTDTDEKLILSKPEGITYKWLRNCGDDVRNHQVRGSQLMFTEVQFSDAGNYFCVAEYKGQQLPVVGYDVCVKHDNVMAESIELDCKGEVKTVILGKDATFSCKSPIATSKANTFSITSKWYKGNSSEVICLKDRSKNPKYECSMKSSISKQPCYTSAPVPNPLIDTYTLNLTIRNVTLSDLGLYMLRFKWHTAKYKWVNLTLEEDIREIAAGKIIALSVSGSLLFLLLLLLIVYFIMKDDINWFLKKHFGKYDTEPYSYAAYFAYYYDLDHESTEEMKMTKSLIENLHDFMNKFGLTVYDEQRNPNVVGGAADNIKLVVGDCHRILVVLSAEYVKDQWSQFKTNTALTQAVESGKKIIFITMPHSKTAISELDEAPRKTLRAAMNRNVTIRWNGKVPFNGRFRRRLEYGLPKLQKPDYSRYLSDSSQVQLTYQNKQTNGHDHGSHTATTNGFSSAV